MQSEVINTIKWLTFTFLLDTLVDLTREEFVKLASHAYTNNKQQLKDDIATIRDPPISSKQWQNPDYCKCGMCKEMPTDIENKCWKQKRCLSKANVFVNICINKENLQTAIRNSSDTYVFTPRYANRSMWHAAYRQYVMWKHGHVGGRCQVVIPSCCVYTIRNAYLSPTNQYTGFLNFGGLAICN